MKRVIKLSGLFLLAVMLSVGYSRFVYAAESDHGDSPATTETGKDFPSQIEDDSLVIEDDYYYTTETPYPYPDVNTTEDIHVDGNDGSSEYAVFGSFFTWAKNTNVPIPYFDITFWEIGLYGFWIAIIFMILTGVIHGIADD